MADAATMGLHWIYDQAKIQTLLADKGKQSSPEFYEPPSCPFYQVGTGMWFMCLFHFLAAAVSGRRWVATGIQASRQTSWDSLSKANMAAPELFRPPGCPF